MSKRPPLVITVTSEWVGPNGPARAVAALLKPRPVKASKAA